MEEFTIKQLVEGVTKQSVEGTLVFWGKVLQAEDIKEREANRLKQEQKSKDEAERLRIAEQRLLTYKYANITGLKNVPFAARQNLKIIRNYLAEQTCGHCGKTRVKVLHHQDGILHCMKCVTLLVASGKLVKELPGVKASP